MRVLVYVSFVRGRLLVAKVGEGGKYAGGTGMYSRCATLEVACDE